MPANSNRHALLEVSAELRGSVGLWQLQNCLQLKKQEIRMNRCGACLQCQPLGTSHKPVYEELFSDHDYLGIRHERRETSLLSFVNLVASNCHKRGPVDRMIRWDRTA